MTKANKNNALLETLRGRFELNMKRHSGIAWAEVRAAIERHSSALAILQRMEASGGEPDCVGRDADSRWLLCDCSPESPKGRRSLCYDREARTARKEAAPASSALEMAKSMGVELMNEADYARLQRVGEFDLKTSSWLLTPADVRGLGGAIFGDRRYGRVFVYHNGAQSYYAARGFRAMLRI
jgi:Protein of unknown function (DUF4256)